MPLGAGPVEVHAPFAATVDIMNGLPRYPSGALEYKLRKEVGTPLASGHARIPTPSNSFRPRTAQARLSGERLQQQLQLGTAVVRQVCPLQNGSSAFRGWDDRTSAEATSSNANKNSRETGCFDIDSNGALTSMVEHAIYNADGDSDDDPAIENGLGSRPESQGQNRKSWGSSGSDVAAKASSGLRRAMSGQTLRRPPSAPACQGARRSPGSSPNSLTACISGAPLNAARANNPRHRASFAINGKFGAVGVRPASAVASGPGTAAKPPAQQRPTRPSSAGTADPRGAATRRSSSTGALVREEGVQGGLLAGRYRTGRVLGRGASAVVWEGVHGSSGHRLALKAFEKGGGGWTTRQRQALREAKLLEMLQHDRIIRTLESFETTLHFYIVCELVDGGSLRQLLRRQPMNRVSEETAKMIFKQICEGLKFCHDRNVVHRDIKLENVLLERETNSVKIIDFGFACQVKSHDVKLRVFCGTPSYMAPEMVSGLEYSGFMTDIWSLGVMLFVLLAGRFPFAADSEAQLYARIKRGKFRCPDVIGDEPRQIIGAALRMDSRGRMQVDQMLKHPWLGLSQCSLSPKVSLDF